LDIRSLSFVRLRRRTNNTAVAHKGARCCENQQNIGTRLYLVRQKDSRTEELRLLAFVSSLPSIAFLFEQTHNHSHFSLIFKRIPPYHPLWVITLLPTNSEKFFNTLFLVKMKVADMKQFDHFNSPLIF
jgi:hypothetical protein